jgi:hypothetical protein
MGNEASKTIHEVDLPSADTPDVAAKIDEMNPKNTIQGCVQSLEAFVLRVFDAKMFTLRKPGT